MKVIFCESGQGGGSVSRLIQLLGNWDFQRVPAGVFALSNQRKAEQLLASKGAAFAETMAVKGREPPDPVRAVMGIPFPTIHGIAYFLRALRLLRAHPGAVIYLNNTPYAHAPLIAAAALFRRRVVCHLRDVSPLTAISRALAPAIDSFIVLSESARDYYARQGIPAQKITVVYDSIDLAALDQAIAGRPQPKKRVRNAVVVGTLCRRKGQDVCVKAFELVARQVPDAHLSFLGEGEAEQELKAMVAAAGLGDRVSFLGYRSDVAAAIADCDIGILSSRREGMPNSVMEYMAAGLPVLVSELPGIRELVVDGESGFIVPQEDHEALARRWVELLQDDRLREKMGSAGRTLIERDAFTPETERLSIRSIIERTWEARHGAPQGAGSR